MSAPHAASLAEQLPTLRVVHTPSIEVNESSRMTTGAIRSVVGFSLRRLFVQRFDPFAWVMKKLMLRRVSTVMLGLSA
jgi:hypothetical protein